MLAVSMECTYAAPNMYVHDCLTRQVHAFSRVKLGPCGLCGLPTGCCWPGLLQWLACELAVVCSSDGRWEVKPSCNRTEQPKHGRHAFAKGQLVCAPQQTATAPHSSRLSRAAVTR